MENILIKDIKGNKIAAKFVLAFNSTKTQKTYIVLDNSDIVFSNESSYNNLDVFEVNREENNIYYVSDIPDSEWNDVKENLIEAFFSKIL